MGQKVRVRFAPSPTGPLHIGGVRTALFNYLFAKHHQGEFILRIEDTDQNRYVEGAEEYIHQSLEWCGIEIDEGPKAGGKFGPYRQSERKNLYGEYVEKLVEIGNAYYAFDTADELEAHRKDHEAKGKTFIYNWHNRLKLKNSLSLAPGEVQEKIKKGEPYVVRFKSPQDQNLQLTDIIRGEIEIDTNILDDKVLFKSDGMPTYHLANIVDDHLMEITHVIRGEEWLPSLALHYQLYTAFGWEPPKFAHLPLILKPTGKGKLSKRDGEKLGVPVFPLEWSPEGSKENYRGFREEGYFPEAVVNFLAFLGWNPGTEQEFFNIDELIDAFNLEQVNKSGSKFDIDKIQWFNHHYMQQQPSEGIAKAFKKRTNELDEVDVNYITLVVDLIKERANLVSDLWSLSHYFFQPPPSFDENAFKKAVKEGTTETLESVKQIILITQEFTAANLQFKIKEWITENQIGFGKVMMPLRLALVGELQGPDVFEIMFLIGKAETVNRINRLLKEIG